MAWRLIRDSSIVAALIIITCSCSGASRSNSLVQVPRLVGKQEKAAKAALEHLGLKEKIVIQRRSPLIVPPRESVISQSPSGGKNVAHGTIVTLVVYI